MKRGQLSVDTDEIKGSKKYFCDKEIRKAVRVGIGSVKHVKRNTNLRDILHELEAKAKEESETDD